MARVADNTGRYDIFKVKCTHCGREIKYGRKDIRQHRRWPNGFIYCPGCKAPIGHDENNLFESGQEVLDKRAQEIQKRAEERSKIQGADVKALPSQAKVYRILKIVLLATGIPTLVTGALGTLLAGASVFEEALLFIFLFAVFPVGLGATITGGIFSKKYNECVLMMNQQEEKKEQ